MKGRVGLWEDLNVEDGIKVKRTKVDASKRSRGREEIIRSTIVRDLEGDVKFWSVRDEGHQKQRRKRCSPARARSRFLRTAAIHPEGRFGLKANESVDKTWILGDKYAC